jgi:hypothetical protein
MWEDHVEFKQSLTDSWNENRRVGNLHDFQQKLKQVSGHLVRWDRATFGNVCRVLQALKMELDRMQSHPLRTGPSHAELKISEKIMELNHREEVMWRQRSRILWLSAGDRNTRFFHIRASRLREQNKIVKLKKLDGQFTVNEQELGEITTEFYKTLYTSDSTENMEAVLDTVPVKVSPEMNAKLIAPYTEAEVKEALFQMFPIKSPGPDGFPAHFFQRHWDLCGLEVTTIVLRVLRGEDDAKTINDTFIVLIPKVASPEELGQFRLISLCNVIYKIASKVVANRLKVILPESFKGSRLLFQEG